LIINFCNRKARPSVGDLYADVQGVFRIKRELGVPVHFRHIPRERNATADWLTNVARAHKADVDCTSTCQSLKPFDDPPKDRLGSRDLNLVAPVLTRATNKRLRQAETGPTLDTSSVPTAPSQAPIQTPIQHPPRVVVPPTETTRPP
jgi:hypothetical protein